MQRLVWSFRAALEKTFVERLPALEPSLQGVPKLDLRFAQLPTEQYSLFPKLAGEIQQTLVEIFYLNTDLVDFLDCVLSLLHGSPLG
jgi:hypothetical protein